MGMTIAGNRYLRAALLCLLYFAQGFPWGFAIVALLSVLSEAGHSKEQTAVITSLAVLPWTFKFFWAPLIDSLRLPSLGVRRPWIIVAQTGMAATLLGVWATGDLEKSATLDYLAWVFFVHNCFASLQDVATDALAVDLLEDAERGRVNGLMWGSKLAGIAAGGGGMGIVIARAGIPTAVLVQALGVTAILCLVIVFRERRGERLFPWSKGKSQVSDDHRVSGGLPSVLRELRRALSLRTTFVAALLALTVHLAEGLYVPLTTDVFVQEFGWTAEQFSSTHATWGVLGELIGALGGGVLCDRFGRRRMASLGLLGMFLTLVVFSLTADLWHDARYPRTLLLPMFKGSMAFATVCLFSLYMKICWTGAAASQFTLYMALSNVGHFLGARLNSLNTWIRSAAEAGWSSLSGVELTNADFYLIAGCCALLPLVPMGFLDPDSVVKRRLAERPHGVDSPASP